MTVVIEVKDDSGATQGILEIPIVELQSFEDQLPDGWYAEGLDN